MDNLSGIALVCSVLHLSAAATAAPSGHPAAPPTTTSSAIRVAVIEPVICRGADSCKPGEWSMSGQISVFTLDPKSLGIPTPKIRVLNTRFDCVDHCSTPSPSVTDLEVLVTPTATATETFETPPTAVRIKAPGIGDFRERWLISILYLDDAFAPVR